MIIDILTLIGFLVVGFVVLGYIFLAFGSYLQMCNAARLGYTDRYPRFWRWMLPIPGNSEWFYHPPKRNRHD